MAPIKKYLDVHNKSQIGHKVGRHFDISVVAFPVKINIDMTCFLHILCGYTES